MADSTSHTAQDYIAAQLRLESDAREALPYQFDACTKPLGSLRQSVFACLTCTPPPASKYQQFTPAGVCYSCSISCHGEHNLVELFTKRDFVCDCGTTRLENSGTVCTLRGGVKGEEPAKGNRYNHNYEGRFCGCGEEYDPELEKGTMFQCLGLGGEGEGGCGEDWWHAECLMGLPRSAAVRKEKEVVDGGLDTVKEEGADVEAQTEEVVDEEEPPLPPGFPDEDAFDHLVCYKCVNAFPWIKQYAGTEGFLPAVPADGSGAHINGDTANGDPNTVTPATTLPNGSNKRKADDDVEGSHDGVKKARASPAPQVGGSEQEDQPAEAAPSILAATDALQENGPPATVPPQSNDTTATSTAPPAPRHTTLPPPPTGPISLFLTQSFRSNLCRCPTCFPLLAPHRQLLEEEDAYEPPLSESDNHSITGRSIHSGSILERGEAALSGMDRVKAIEGVMAYNKVRDKVKEFLQPFAESGQAVGADDIKAYFAKLRGDDEAIREAGVGAG